MRMSFFKSIDYSSFSYRPFFLTAVAVLVLGVASCKKPSKKTPAPTPPTVTDEDTKIVDPKNPLGLTVTLDGATGNRLEIEAYKTTSRRFNIRGSIPVKDLVIVLTEAPRGSKLLEANTLTPQFTWKAEGPNQSFPLKLFVRNYTKCLQFGNASECIITANEGVADGVHADTRFDSIFDFQIAVVSIQSPNNNNNNNTGPDDTYGDDFANNGFLGGMPGKIWDWVKSGGTNAWNWIKGLFGL